MRHRRPPPLLASVGVRMNELRFGQAQEEGRGEISGGDFMWHSVEQEREVCTHSSCHAPLRHPDRLAAGLLDGPLCGVESEERAGSASTHMGLLTVPRCFST